MRTRKKYMNGQPRGGLSGRPTETTGMKPGRNPKDYHKVSVAFHGGEMAYNEWVEEGRKGYGFNGRK